LYKTIRDIKDVDGKRVLLRVDYNVKVKDGKIKDDTRITESIPTISYLIDKGAKIIIIAHLGRPQEELAEGKAFDEVKRENTLAPVAAHLGELINRDVGLAPDCIGSKVEGIISRMHGGDVVILENLRLHKEEEGNSPEFAKALAGLCDVYVFDGFGVAHRAHASTVGVPLYMLQQNKPVAAGFLMDKELKLWEEARKKQGYKLLVIGGAKLEEKTKAVGKLYNAVDAVLVGGAVYNVVMAGKGIDVGSSMVEEKGGDYTGKGKELADSADNLLLPEQAVIAQSDGYGDIRTINISDGVPEGYMIADIVIDKKTKAAISKAQVVIWLGNIGMSDVEVDGKFPFAKGTDEFKKAISRNAYVIVGGGDSVTASEGLSNRVISTGGGAAIELYTKGTLDALEALKGNAEYFKR